jgi:adenosylmethionine-8-amino-7-oxononanoate aminotransferase
MTMTDVSQTRDYQQRAAAHLWRHFANLGAAAASPPRVIVRGEGCHLFDSDGNRYLDGVSNLFCVNLGYSFGDEFAEAAGAQLRELGYQSTWGSAHPRAIELAEAIAGLAPDGFEHVFFTPSGGESVEAAWKIARQYYSLRGEHRWKAIARQEAYHGTTLGALSLMGLNDYRTTFEPLLPGVAHVRNTSRARRPAGETDEEFCAFLLDDLEQRIVSEDPSTVAMVIMEPLQNHGGCLVPPPGYSAGVREICDRYGILLVADETITGFGRLGEWFASERYEMSPDIITTAKGLSSAHAVIGAVVLSDELHEAFTQPGVILNHGNTYGGHPVMCAIALKNIEIMQRVDICGHVRAREGAFRSALESLLDIAVVESMSGAGYFYAVELVSTTSSGTELTPAQMDEMYGMGSIAARLAQRGLLCRVMVEGGRPLMYIGPPLVADHDEFETIRSTLADVFSLVSDEHASLLAG